MVLPVGPGNWKPRFSEFRRHLTIDERRSDEKTRPVLFGHGRDFFRAGYRDPRTLHFRNVGGSAFRVSLVKKGVELPT